MRISVPVADGFLLVCAVLWGAGFVAQRIATQEMGDTPFTFNSARFLLGAILLFPFIVRRTSARTKVTMTGGIIAACVMLLAASLQQKAMSTVTAGTAGFITGTYVIWTPLLGLCWGQRVTARVWIGAVLSLVGLWFLTMQGGREFSAGDLYLLGCAIAWALHVHVIGWAAMRGDALGIAFVQFLVTGILSGIIAIGIEPVSIDLLRMGSGAIAFSAVFSIGIAFTLQVLAQTSAPPAHAAIILSLESLFAEISGSLWLKESFDPRKWVGASLMMIGALVATVTGLRGKTPLPPSNSAG